MALQKSINTSFGIPATYWRIIRINELFGGNEEVFLAGYTDAEARANGAEPLEIRTITIPSQDGTRADIYPLLKVSKIETRPTGETTEDGEPVTEEVETNEFADAVDC